MRTAFIEALCEVAEQNDRIWLLTGDLGYSVLERFSTRFPDRYLNVGVAEQNMTGVAAGIALSGGIAFTYSIANFPIMRCLEQIRNDVCYHNANVKVVAVGGGLAYGSSGYTHHGIEDLAIMRALPGMTVVAPGDPIETKLAVRALVEHDGPCYLRLGKAGEPVVHGDTPSFQLGRAITLREDADVTIVSTGGMLKTSLEAADLLAAQGIDCGVLSMHTVKPLDTAALIVAAQSSRCIITVEEHSVIGGLGSAVAEFMAELPAPKARLLRAGLNDCYLDAVYSQEAARAKLGLDAAGLARRVVEAL